MPGAKSKKNANKDGGVVAAVTKHAAGKFANGNGNANASKAPASETSSPSLQSPDLKPASPPTNGGLTASPLLDAVSTTSFATSTAPSTNEWVRGVPGLAGSPGNLISLMGESPPTQPSSYEDPRGMPYGWSSPRTYMNAHPASASPPTSNAARRPLSFQMDAHYQPSEANAPSTVPSVRRSSMHSHSHAAYARGSPNPPLPHQMQPHFYGTPDIDVGLQGRAGIRAGERGYAFTFDTLPTTDPEGAAGKENVVLAGYEGGLEVYTISKKGTEHLASLQGLRGGVYQAKVLPWLTSGPGSDLGPLVTVVVHGPVLPPRAPGINVEGEHEGGPGDRSDSPARETLGAKIAPPVDFYQTTVEVYSLQDGKCIAVLLEAPKVPLSTPITSPIFKAPPPSGALRVIADGGNIVVSSGVTGECWIYRQTLIAPDTSTHFTCVGKLWTTLQQPPRPETAQESERARTSQARQSSRSPIVSLNGRWIAFCPATPSSQVSLRASIPVPAQGRAPGIATLTPPQLPSGHTELDLPNPESAMNKIMRDATQEIISGAKWVGQQSWQTLNNYWKGSSNPPPTRSPPLGSQPWTGAYPIRQEQFQFPPTHGTVAPAVSKEPGLVSIVDVETLSISATVHPISTFPAPLGCSFLAFSPSGLSLFTASSKGDVQTLWDLMRLQFTRASPLQTTNATSLPPGPHVRQIAQFSRMTVARIVDIAWARPNGGQAAMVTERGTIHLLEVPSSAFTWPPPRRRSRPQEAAATVSEGGNSAVSIASSALSTAFDVARPLINRRQRSSSSVMQTPQTSQAAQTTSSKFVEHASHGGRVIAAGISHSLGKTGNAISQLRHTGENRVSLPPSSFALGPSCVVWISGRAHQSLFALGDGLVRLFPPKSRRQSSTSDRQRTPRLSRYRDFKLQLLPDDTIAPAVKRVVDPDEYLDLFDKDTDAGNNTMVLGARPTVSKHDLSVESAIPHAEIESSAPYQPFHTDRRVALYEYGADKAQAVSQLPTVSVLLTETPLDERSTKASARRKQKKDDQWNPSAWAFGQPIEATRLNLGHHQLTEEESLHMSTDDSRALPPSAIERVLQHVGEEDEQIVVTTRRRRGPGRPPDPDDDGFFEDDCEVLDFADQRV